MFLYGDEGANETFLGAQVCDAPKGLFLVGDVALNDLHEDGTIDIGSKTETRRQLAVVIEECKLADSRALGGLVPLSKRLSY
ncbi:MAG TPA: hypothetical protein VN258_16945 [Mobilitalea sp.]|nr:hypothetical protein [Mobilitalea sp.]